MRYSYEVVHDIQNAYRYMMECSSSLIMKMQIKRTMIYHFTPMKLAHVSKSKMYQCCHGCGEKSNPHTLSVGMLTHSSPLENNMYTSQKNLRN